MYYPCSVNKGADQLGSCCEADLLLCFRIGKNPVFSRCGSNEQGCGKIGVQGLRPGLIQTRLHSHRKGFEA